MGARFSINPTRGTKWMAHKAQREKQRQRQQQERNKNTHTGSSLSALHWAICIVRLAGMPLFASPPMASSRRRRSGTAKYGLSASREADHSGQAKKKEKQKKPPPGKSARGKMPSTNEAVKYLTKYTAIDNRAERNQPLLIPSAFFHPSGRCEKSHKTTILLSTPTQTHTREHNRPPSLGDVYVYLSKLEWKRHT